MRRHVGHLFEGWLDGCHDGTHRARLDRRRGTAGSGMPRSSAPTSSTSWSSAPLAENRKPGQNVYIGQALRQPDIAPFGRCKDDEFSALTAFYVDIDDDVTATASINYRNRGCPPTGVVITGRHPHLRAQMLWRLNAPVRDADECRRQNMALAQALDGDPSVVNPSRVLRLGGSIAWPVKEGRIIERTEFLDFDDGRPKATCRSRSPGRFRRRSRRCRHRRSTPEPPSRQQLGSSPTSLAADYAAGVNPPSPTLQIGSTNLSVDDCIARIRAGDHWHDNMVRLTGHWIARGWSDAEILTAAEAMTLPGYTRRRHAARGRGDDRRWADGSGHVAES